jgi:hypothetical protein
MFNLEKERECGVEGFSYPNPCFCSLKFKFHKQAGTFPEGSKDKLQ